MMYASGREEVFVCCVSGGCRSHRLADNLIYQENDGLLLREVRQASGVCSPEVNRSLCPEQILKGDTYQRCEREIYIQVNEE